VLISATQKNEPSLLSRYLIDLAQSFSRFYNEHHILTEDKTVQDARLLLTDAVGIVIKEGLALLGIKCPSQM
jgi:arginyl-tRNA synthetase